MQTWERQNYVICTILLLSLVSHASIAQTIPASVTVTGACLSGSYSLTKVTDTFESTGKPAFQGTGSVTINATPYQGVGMTLYYEPAGPSWVLAFDGQPYQSNTSTATLPPMSGWTAVAANDGLVGQCVGSNPLSVDYVVPGVSVSPASSSVCTGSLASLTALATNFPGAVTYTWASTPAGFSGSGSTMTLTQNAPAVNALTTYTISVTATSGTSSATASASVTVKPLPQISITPSSTAICAGQSATLMAMGGATYRWSTGLTTSSISATATGTYSVTALGANGCSGTATAGVTVNPLPMVSITPSATAICAGQSATLMASAGATYRWSTGLTTSSISATATGTYAVTVTNASGCSNTATASVIVNQLPVVSITPSSTVICAGQSTLLTATPGLTYRWTTNQSSQAISVSATGPYSVTATDANGCANSATAGVIVNQLPTVTITPSATTVCAGQAATFTASTGTAYQWSNGSTTASISASITGSYSVTVTNASGCSNTAMASLSVTPLPDAAFTGLPAAICVNATPVTLTPATGGGSFSGPGISDTSFNPASAGVGGPYSITYTVSSQGCANISSQNVTVLAQPSAPSLVTQSGQPYPAGQSSLTISQNTGNVILTTSGCSGGTLTWAGGSNTTLAVSTLSTGTQTFTAICQTNGCTSPVATAMVIVVPTTLSVSHLDATFGQTSTNTIKPYLQLNNSVGDPIPYNEITVRYWLTVENNVPITNFQTYFVQLGANNVHIRYVPLTQPRQGATAYVEYSFDVAAGNLGTGSNSGPIQNSFGKSDYSGFNQADDYSYMLNRDFTPNQHITAYRNGVIFWGQEPTGSGTGVVTPLTLTATANPTTILTTGITTLVATVSGGTTPYLYSFSGPGAITPGGNTATVSGLATGVQTFTVIITDASQPASQSLSTTVSVTVNQAPSNTAPVPVANSNQSTIAGMAFSYTVNAFSDTETPNGLTYSASISPANGLSFNPATRVISGMTSTTGVSTVTITATDPGSLSASTTFTITTSPVPVVNNIQLSVLHQDATFGQTNTNTIKPFLELANSGAAAIPYSAITVRYWLTVEGNVPITNFQNYYVQLGSNNVHARYMALANPVNGANGYVEYSFDAASGSLAPGANSGPIQNAFVKQDYSGFNQTDDYSYALNRDYVANPHITAYLNGTLVYGTEPVSGVRLAAESTVPLQVSVLGNPIHANQVKVEVSGAEGQALRYEIMNLSGHTVTDRRVGQAGALDRQTIDLINQPSGIYLLQVSTPTAKQVLKVVKP